MRPERMFPQVIRERAPAFAFPRVTADSPPPAASG